MFLVFHFLHHFHSKKLVQDRISKFRNLLRIVINPIKFGGIAQDNQQHDTLKYYLWAAVPFNEENGSKETDLYKLISERFLKAQLAGLSNIDRFTRMGKYSKDLTSTTPASITPTRRRCDEMLV